MRKLRGKEEDVEATGLTELREYLEERAKALEREAALLEGASKLLETYIKKATPPMLRIAESIRSLLPEEARAKFSVEETESSFRIRVPYGVLSRQQFASVTRHVESMEGKWISAGKDSHWEVPKRKKT